MSITNETRHIEWHETCNAYQMQVFVRINKGGIKINADVNAKNGLTKVYAIKDLFGIPVTVGVNVINRVILVSIQTMKIISVEKNQLINWLKNVLKLMMK